MEAGTTNLPATIETGHSKLSNANSSVIDLSNLPARLDDSTLAMVEAMASSPLPALAPCDPNHFGKVLWVLLASLPKRKSDDISGELLINAYRRMLGHLPTAQIDHLAVEVLAKCEWFPSIAECLRLAESWTRNDDALRNKGRAAVIARNERQARLDETMAALERGELSGEQIGALPERFIQIAHTRGLIWAETDGTFRPRPLRKFEEIADQSDAESVDDLIGSVGVRAA
jgi:hypothetical protein